MGYGSYITNDLNYDETDRSLQIWLVGKDGNRVV